MSERTCDACNCKVEEDEVHTPEECILYLLDHIEELEKRLQDYEDPSPMEPGEVTEGVSWRERQELDGRAYDEFK